MARFIYVPFYDLVNFLAAIYVPLETISWPKELLKKNSLGPNKHYSIGLHYSCVFALSIKYNSVHVLKYFTIIY